MRYRTRRGQTSAGEAIGILLLETSVPFIPGDVANATSYTFPVRFQPVKGYTVARALACDASVYPALREAADALVAQGVRAVTGDCGFMLRHHQRLADELGVPVFLSSLLQLPFLLQMLGRRRAVGVITADSTGLDGELLSAAGVSEPARVVVAGLEQATHFRRFALEESGELDSDAVAAEVIAAGQRLIAAGAPIGALLLECSLLPPYAAALQAAVQVPVFDYLTMINYVFSGLIRREFNGYL